VFYFGTRGTLALPTLTPSQYFFLALVAALVATLLSAALGAVAEWGGAVAWSARYPSLAAELKRRRAAAALLRHVPSPALYTAIAGHRVVVGAGEAAAVWAKLPPAPPAPLASALATEEREYPLSLHSPAAAWLRARRSEAEAKAAAAAKDTPVPLFETCDAYIHFERTLKDNVQLQAKDSIRLTKKDSFKSDSEWGSAILQVSLDWAEASLKCHRAKKYVNYDDDIMTGKAIELADSLPTINITSTNPIADDGWCFYNALLTASRLSHAMQDCRTFALELSKNVLSNIPQNKMKATSQAKVNGYDVQITDHQLVKLFSIPSFDNKNNPCVYADTTFLGNAAAVYLNKNILIYADYNGSNKNCGRVGIHVVTELTPPDNNIMLRRCSSTPGETGYNHFDIITKYTVVSPGQGGSKKRTTRRNAKNNINTKRLSKRNAKHNKNIKTKRKSNK
jgi:hypothetical protein